MEGSERFINGKERKKKKTNRFLFRNKVRMRTYYCENDPFF